MRTSRAIPPFWFLVVLFPISVCLGACAWMEGRPRAEDPSLAPYVVTPQETVDEMLRLAGVGGSDVLYDLGSGDGRIVTTAARIYGLRGVGFELDPDLVRRSFENARRAGVSHLVDFRQQDVLTVDFSPATVVTVYFSREANLLLRPHEKINFDSGNLFGHCHRLGRAGFCSKRQIGTTFGNALLWAYAQSLQTRPGPDDYSI